MLRCKFCVRVAVGVLLKKFNNMKRYYKVDIHPKNNECPISKTDCNNCKFCKYIGTLGGEYYIDCTYNE